MRSEADYVEFVATRRTHLRRVAYALTGDWHLAEDLVQTALAKVYVAWPRITGAEEAYARKVILNAVIDERRRPWRRETPVVEHRDRPAPEPTGPEVRDEVVAALQQLPAMQRKAVLLRHWLDLSVEETARELGVSTGTVKSHTSRGLDRLQSLLTAAAAASDLDLAGRNR